MSRVYKITEKKLNNLIENIINELSGGEEYSLSNKDDIKYIQSKLKNTEFGALLGKTGPNKDGVDGILGPTTKRTLDKFQNKNNITDEQGTIGPKTIKALNLIKSKQTNEQKLTPSKNYLYYDGKTLKFIINGKVAKQWNAWSGRTKWNALTPYQQKLAATLTKIEFSKIKDQGPIPEGSYYISQMQSRTNGNSLKFCANKDWVQIGKLYWDEYKKIGDRHDFNSGTAQDLIAWGNYRLPIKAKPGTNTYNRGSFYIHGGGTAGSIGCIDLVDKIDDFAATYKSFMSSSKSKTLDLYVDYSNKMKTTAAPVPLGIPQNVGQPKETDTQLYKKPF